MTILFTLVYLALQIDQEGAVVMRTAKLLVIAGITFLLAGCKLAVINVEGGEVQSTGSGTCVAGTVCLIDVADTSFSETFTAVPDEGWYFHKWNQGGRFFCGNSFNSECSLSFEGLQGEENIESLVASSEMFYLMPVFKDYPRSILAGPRIIEVDGKRWEWLQPVDFTGYSYAQISRVCPKGVCSGNLPGSSIELTGFTWASSDDVRLLFQAYDDAGIAVHQDFEATMIDRSSEILSILRDKPDREGLVVFARLYWAHGDESSPEYSEFNNFIGAGLDDSYHIVGAWFWRTLD